MGVSLTLKHIKELGAGRYEYRRRVPESAKAAMGKSEFKRVFAASSPAALAREHARITAEFDKAVAETQRKPQDPSKMTPRETWEEARKEAQRLTAGAIGLNEVDAGIVVADLMEEQGISSPLLAMALRDPYNASEDNPLPDRTLEDARKLYVNEKLGGGDGPENREAMARIERVFAKAVEALGDDVRDRPLDSLKREDARKVRDHMLQSQRKGGGTVSPATVRRELKTLSAVVNFGLREFDLSDASNPFDKLPVEGVSKGSVAVQPDAALRDPLPKPMVVAMRSRLTGDLQLIWRLLAGTGCRLSEVRGLRVEDVATEAAIPHIRVTWHEGRRLKTKASVRVVPLVGDALAAAKDALKAAEGKAVLFPRFAKPRGTDNCSTQLMKHLRQITADPKHVVHSLRHSMKDDLRLAGVEKTVQDLILGHASPSIGETYGGEEARLQVAHRALLKVAEVSGSAPA
ncbi:MAG: tyrosine-type recombinase/integrase [Rhodobacteraceae bacterium]|nr:tyrosine-type recombinase/integrase [Paracoccaceae bacterium]